jgi:hypothetical protein
MERVVEAVAASHTADHKCIHGVIWHHLDLALFRILEFLNIDAIHQGYWLILPKQAQFCMHPEVWIRMSVGLVGPVNPDRLTKPGGIIVQDGRFRSIRMVFDAAAAAVVA